MDITQSATLFNTSEGRMTEVDLVQRLTLTDNLDLKEKQKRPSITLPQDDLTWYVKFKDNSKGNWSWFIYPISAIMVTLTSVRHITNDPEEKNKTKWTFAEHFSDLFNRHHGSYVNPDLIIKKLSALHSRRDLLAEHQEITTFFELDLMLGPNCPWDDLRPDMTSTIIVMPCKCKKRLQQHTIEKPLSNEPFVVLSYPVKKPPKNTKVHFQDLVNEAFDYNVREQCDSCKKKVQKHKKLGVDPFGSGIIFYLKREDVKGDGQVEVDREIKIPSTTIGTNIAYDFVCAIEEIKPFLGNSTFMVHCLGNERLVSIRSDGVVVGKEENLTNSTMFFYKKK